MSITKVSLHQHGITTLGEMDSIRTMSLYFLLRRPWDISTGRVTPSVGRGSKFLLELCRFERLGYALFIRRNDVVTCCNAS